MYFKLFVSSIYIAQNNGIMSDVWKFLSSFYVAVAVACNILLLFVIINNHLVPNSLNALIINYSSLGKYNFILNIFISLIIPIMIFNYFTVFRKHQYKKLISKNLKYYSKTLFVIYFLISFLSPLIYLITQIDIRW
jgi:hypothetical protein